MRDPVNVAHDNEQERMERLERISYTMTAEDKQSIAERLVHQHLGSKDHDWNGLCDSLASSHKQREQFYRLYQTNRKEWLRVMIAHAVVLWEDEIIELYIDKCQQEVIA